MSENLDFGNAPVMSRDEFEAKYPRKTFIDDFCSLFRMLYADQNISIEVRNITRSSGDTYTGGVINKNGGMNQPILDLDMFYDTLAENDISLIEMLQATQVVVNNIPTNEQFDLTNYEQMKGFLRIHDVTQKALDDKPGTLFIDDGGQLKAFYLEIPGNIFTASSEHNGICMVQKEFLEAWDVSKEQILDDALANGVNGL